MSTTKRLKGIPVYYDELKKLRSVNLTDTVWKALKLKSTEQGISISEYIERWVRKSEGS